MSPTLNRYRARILLTVALVAAGTTLGARTAAAHANDNIVGTAAAAMIAFPTIGIPGIITAVHNGMNRGELTDGWKTAGTVLGTLNVIAGVVLPLAGSIGCNGSECLGLNLAWSIPPLINGALNLVFALTGKRAEVATPMGKLSLVPVTGMGAQNKVFGGVGVNLASF